MIIIKEGKFKIDKIKIHQIEIQIKKMKFQMTIAVKFRKKTKMAKQVTQIRKKNNSHKIQNLKMKILKVMNLKSLKI